MTLLPRHEKLIRASAISDGVAQRRGYWSALKTGELERYFGRSQRLAPGLVIPTYDVFGEVVFHQLRPDAPRVVKGRVRKYEIPFGTRMAIDVPPGVRGSLDNPAVPLLITEGARKADAGLSAGFCAIDLFGVWMWRGRNGDGGSTALADFERIAFNERIVYLAFDSDAMQKREVHAALERLVSFLRRRDADVRVVYLPSGEGGAKTGLDDYLAAGHTRDDVLALAVDDLRPLGGSSADGAGGKPTSEPAEVKPVSLPDAVGVYRRWLWLADPEVLYALWGAVAANRLGLEPVWLLLVDTSGGGKTELIRACGDLPECAHISSLTEAGLLSGTSRAERAESATGGVLRKLGERGVIVAKDFTSLLAMEKDSRSKVLAALREVYDGDYTRQLGIDGGVELRWRGKAGLIGGAPEIDQQYLVMARLGQRFLLYRPSRWEERDTKATERALKNAHKVGRMRDELRAAALGVFAGLRGPTPLSEAESAWLIGLAGLVARARAGVVTAYNGKIIDKVAPETPTRLAQALAGLRAGMDSIGVERGDAINAARDTALGCVPAVRLAALDFLYERNQAMATTEIAVGLGQPTDTARRVLHELGLHGLAKRGSKQGAADRWSLTGPAREALQAARASPTTPPSGFPTDGSEPPVEDPERGVQHDDTLSDEDRERQEYGEQLFDEFGPDGP
jgi:hypothetical protein